jgi:MoxR-like ATPase
LSDALKRRCLYLYLELPDRAKEKAVIDRKVGGLSEDRLEAMCRVASILRERPLLKRPGLAEMIDWGEALKALSPADGNGLTREHLEQTLGCLLKEAEDVTRIEDELEDVLAEASQLDARDETSS